MKYLIQLLLIFFSITVFAQNRTFIKGEIGPKYDLSQVSDPQGYLDAFPIPYFTTGGRIAHEIKKNQFLSLGCYYNEYSESVHFKEATNSISFANACATIQFPLTYAYRFNIRRQNIFIEPKLGLTTGINFEYYPEDSIGALGGGDLNLGTVSYDYTYEGNYSYRRLFFLLETGINFDFRIYRDLFFSISANYYQGLQKLYTQDVEYNVNEEGPYTADYVYKGSNAQLLFGLNYQMNKLWDGIEVREKNKEVIAKNYDKITNSKFTLAVEGGSVHHQFNTIADNDVIGGVWPRSEKIRFLDFSNFSASIKLAYLLKKHMIIESGINTSYFSNIYSLNIEEYKNNCITVRFPGTNFTEIPLYFKYRQNLLKNRLFIVPYLGASGYLSKTKGEYGQDNGMLTYTDDDGNTGNIIVQSTFYGLEQSALRLLFGASIDIAITEDIIFYTSFESTLGFKDLNQSQIKITHANNIYEGDVYYKGNSFRWMYGLKFPIKQKNKPI